MSDQYYVGTRSPEDEGSEFNAEDFHIRQVLGQMWTSTIVKVVAVHNGGGALARAGTVDIVPQVNQMTGQGVPVPHGTIFGVPYMRMQGGTQAIVLDPVVGDLGWCNFASHDISSVLKNAAQSNPGSLRRFSPSDACYIGGIVNGVPTTVLQFDGVGNVNILTPNGKAVGITTGTATITATHANIVSNDVNLGATGGAAVARVGDTVSGGVIISGSSKVKAA